MKKKIHKPFSVEAWKTGAKVETKSGRSVRILCTDIKSAYSIVAATMCEDGEEAVIEYDASGHFCIGSEDNCDLVIVEEVEEPEPWADNKERKVAMERFPLVGRTQAWDVRLIDSCTVVLIPESGEQQPIIQKIR